ncbi:MAG: sensor histidine kinase [Saprospiraceae bacterium]|nr:sensor histidine kinase [Saprospiraceae bacterium]
MFKNLTPRQIAIYSGFASGVAVYILFILFNLLSPNLDWWQLLIAFIVLVGLTYSVNLFFLKKYIFRKIKLIYKTIHRLKLDPSQKQRNIDSDDHIIEDVEKDVAIWARNQQAEIEQLKTLENYRRDFLGNVSHELKTPIFNIQGYIHTLLDGGINDNTINLKYLDRTSKNVERLITIVDDLETISKLESGNLVLDIRKFDIKELVKEVFEAHELSAQRRNIHLLFKDGAAQSFQVKADREYIRQVVDNLVLNSIKYGNPEGFTKVGFYDMDKYILVEVADNGIGIPQEHLKHVFDRFYRVDKSRSRDAGGSGLGLSIVKHIIEAHNQTINVRSAPDVGSTFGFTMEKA